MCARWSRWSDVHQYSRAPKEVARGADVERPPQPAAGAERDDVRSGRATNTERRCMCKMGSVQGTASKITEGCGRDTGPDDIVPVFLLFFFERTGQSSVLEKTERKAKQQLKQRNTCASSGSKWLQHAINKAVVVAQ